MILNELLLFYIAVADCADAPTEDTVDVVIEACGAPSVVKEGISYLRPGGIYILVGMVHPDSVVQILAETVIRKCLTIKGIQNSYVFVHHLLKQ